VVIEIEKIMIKEIIEFLKAWVKGDDAELNIEKEWSYTWWEVAAILFIIGLIIYWIC
jgi:hypothetical protein